MSIPCIPFQRSSHPDVSSASHKRDERTAGCIEYYAHPTVANFERVLSHFSAAGADANISLQVIACVFAKAAVNLIKYGNALPFFSFFEQCTDAGKGY